MNIYGIYDTENNEQCIRVGTLQEIVKFLNLTAKEMSIAVKKNRTIRKHYSKNQISDKVSRKVEENDIKRIELESKIEELEKKVKELREKVEAVEDRLEGLKYKEREILTAYYVEGRTAEDIGNRLYFKLFNQTRSDRHIQRIIEKATEKMIKF